MKKNLLLSLVATLFIFPTVAHANFPDVANTELYYKGILYLQEHGVISGYNDGTFRPSITTNRAEFLAVALKSQGIAEATLAPFAQEHCFSDVRANQWFTKYACYAKNRGLVKGYPDGTFRPNTTINAVEALQIMLNIANISFKKDPAIWYRGVVNKAAEYNLIPLDVNDFGAKLRRDQMADLVTRVLTYKDGTQSVYLGPRTKLTANYQTIQRAAAHKKWDIDPNNNALVLTTILTSQADDERVFTVLMVPHNLAADASLKYIPKQPLFTDEFNTYFYMSSGICILENNCSPTQLAHLDDILLEADLTAMNFALGGNQLPKGCYYVSDFDFSMTFPESWGAIHDFTMLDVAYWESHGKIDAGSYVGQGTVCDGSENQPANLGDNDNRQIRIQGK